MVARRLRPFPILLALVLAALAFLSFTRTLSLRHQLRAQVAAQLGDQLDDQLRQWEERVVQQLDAHLDELGENPGRAPELQARLKTQLGWFDSLYVWTLPKTAEMSGKKLVFPAQFVYPRPAPRERPLTATRGCARVQLFDLVPHDAGADLVNQVRRACFTESLATRLYVAVQLATHLATTDGDPALALSVLEDRRLRPDLSLRAGIGADVSPAQLVSARIFRADLLGVLGRTDEALALYADTGAQVVQLDATELEQVRHWLDFSIVRRLKDAGRVAEAKNIEYAAGRADRRMRAFTEISVRILPLPRPNATQAGRFVYDQYEEIPYIVYFRPISEDLGAGLVLDQPELINNLRRSVRRFRDEIVVTDTSGTWVGGASVGEPIAVSVELDTLRHLRVGLPQSSVEARARRLDGQWFIPLAVTVACVLLGIVALWAEIRASGRQEVMLRRQREFTTRVTHELRTPLAGIRIMAENLELGAYEDDAGREEMARRIIDEADKLTARVQEVLDASVQRQLPSPEPFDPEEPVLAAVDLWGPRLEAAGVSFEADLDVTDEVLGDATAIRDAVGCLLDNALKYRRESVEVPGVWLSMRQNGRWVEIVVEDDGIGVPVDKRAEVFERFARVEGPNRGRAGGTGLGLHQVAETVRLHKGTVQCTDGRDGGARFTIRLPALG